MNRFQQIDRLTDAFLPKEVPETDQGEKIEQTLDLLEKDRRWSRLTKGKPPLCSLILAAAVTALRREYTSGAQSSPGLSIEDACLMAEEELGEDVSFQESREIYDWASRFMQVGIDASLPYFRHLIRADERLLSYLAEEYTLDIRLQEEQVKFLPSMPPPCLIREAAVTQIVRGLSYPGAVLQLAGLEGSGRKFLLSHALKKVGKRMLLLDYRRFLDRSWHQRSVIGIALAREAVLSACGICITGLDEDTCPDRSAMETIRECFLEPALKNRVPLCICTSPDLELSAMLNQFVFRVPVPRLTRPEAILMWQGMARLNGIGEEGDWREAGSKFQLTPGEIQKAVKRLAVLGEPIGSKQVEEACLAALPLPRQGSIKRVDVQYTLDDLKLPQQQKQTLKNICAHVACRYKVYDEWNMKSRFAYGRNVSALFVGPPGTGKTMAAHVMSTMIQLPLYQINLSQVVDKYIGETEKKLEEIFTTAEKSNCILFFDEADSIFGRRSTVKEAKDKYANSEVSYILQRIEQYEGIIILATNYKENIDEAFMRRIRYLVEFNMPDEATRQQIWESGFSPEIPLDGVDIPFLARRFELSGGLIKNIILNAAFLAAQDNAPVNMKHILDCVKTECFKMGKSIVKQDFAEYGALY